MDQETFDKQFAEFKENNDGRFHVQLSYRGAVLNEDTPSMSFDFDYLVFCGWAARRLWEARPARHVDIGSYPFFAACAAPMAGSFEFYDLRPISAPIRGLTCGAADLTCLPFPDGSVESLSCLHALEHVGLGRYGDKLDVRGDVAAAAELHRVLAPGGQLLLVVPMCNPPFIGFNDARRYGYGQVMDLFPAMAVEEYTRIANWTITYDAKSGFCGHSCGCFRLRKK